MDEYFIIHSSAAIVKTGGTERQTVEMYEREGDRDCGKVFLLHSLVQVADL
jgi:hypothetical protein